MLNLHLRHSKAPFVIGNDYFYILQDDRKQVEENRKMSRSLNRFNHDIIIMMSMKNVKLNCPVPALEHEGYV